MGGIFGYESSDAESAEDAIEKLAEAPVDIAVCDVNKSASGGVWLASQIRELHPHTAIIMASRMRDVDVAISGLRNDVVDYLLKPFDRERLGEALSLARDWHRSSAGLDQLQHVLHDRLRRRRAAVAATLADAQDTPEDACDGLIDMLQLHERDGRGHATRVARLTMALADELEDRGGADPRARSQRPAARYRQARHPLLDPAQAGAARRRRMGDHADAPAGRL